MLVVRIPIPWDPGPQESWRDVFKTQKFEFDTLSPTTVTLIPTIVYELYPLLRYYGWV